MTSDHAYHGAELLLDRAQDWRDQAACRDVDSVLADLLFFTDEMSGHHTETDAAKAICAGCDVRRTCLDWALDNPAITTYGVWGALTADERRDLHRARLAEREYLCAECGNTFKAQPRGRPTYCQRCRLIARNRSRRNYEKRKATA